jgi:hypothetical protein
MPKPHFPVGTLVVDMSRRFRNEPAAQTFMLWLLFSFSKYSHREHLLERTYGLSLNNKARPIRVERRNMRAKSKSSSVTDSARSPNIVVRAGRNGVPMRKATYEYRSQGA